MTQAEGPRPGSTVGVVLAGGASRRMGRPKGRLLHPSGRSYLAEALHRLRPWTRVQVVAGHGPGEQVPAHVPWLRDPPGLNGPLAGIAAAVRAFPADYYLILAVDIPGARPERLVRWARRYPGRAVVGADPAGHLQPLAGCYPAAHVRQVWQRLRRGRRRARGWALAGSRAPLRLRGAAWRNLNTPLEAGVFVGRGEP